MTHTAMHLTWAGTALASLLGLCGVAAAQFGTPFGQQPVDEGPVVTPRVVLEHEAIAPGEETRIGVTFEIRRGWHIYWQNSGSGGMPPRIELEVPEGIEVGEFQWPAPQRLVHGGGVILDYIYKDRVTLVAPLKAWDGLRFGSQMTIRASIDWMVCDDEMCIPEDGAAEATLAIATDDVDGRRRSPDRSLFEEADRRMPRALPAGITAGWKDGALHISAPGAERMIFYSLEPMRHSPTHEIEDGAVDGDRMRIRYPAAAREADRVTGVLEVVGGGLSGLYTIDVERSGAREGGPGS